MNPYIPHELPIQNLNWERLAAFLSKANSEVARYDGTLNGIINPEILLSPLTNQEAVLSSRIEGTIASVTEVLQHEAGEIYDENKRKDIREIINYRIALLTGEDYLRERPITLHLIREIHFLLLENVRGKDLTPGKFRVTQNHIGREGCPISEARFVPPDPILVDGCMEAWQNFVSNDYPDPLVQLAIAHAQFEIIHPFNDGNGRLGRMLIPLMLYQKKVLQRPMFYLSEYLESADTEYRDRLLNITARNDWQGWIEFFLTALHAQAIQNNLKAKRILELYEFMKHRFAEITHSQFATSALDTFFSKPIINVTDFVKDSNISNRGTATGILRALEAAELIAPLKRGKGRKPTIYSLPSLLNICEGKMVF